MTQNYLVVIFENTVKFMLDSAIKVGSLTSLEELNKINLSYFQTIIQLDKPITHLK